MKVELTPLQKKNAHEAGLTLKEARELVAQWRRNEKLDQREYVVMSQAERDAHDNR